MNASLSKSIPLDRYSFLCEIEERMKSNAWHKEMYDDVFAKKTIGSKNWAIKSKKEAEFILKILDIPAGSKILDVPCGTGRHSVLFAKQGHRVVGVDISTACISIARRQSRHKNVTYQPCDMSKLQKFDSKFDVVTNLFTSFGYFKDDQENKNVLRGMIRCLKPGGKIVINAINRDFLLPIYRPALWDEADKTVTVQASIYDKKTKYNESYTCIVNNRSGKGTARYHRVRLYSSAEIKSLLKECGCKTVRIWGDFDGNPLNRKKSSHPIYLGIK